jgi:hypothetical protein
VHPKKPFAPQDIKISAIGEAGTQPTLRLKAEIGIVEHRTSLPFEINRLHFAYPWQVAYGVAHKR